VTEATAPGSSRHLFRSGVLPIAAGFLVVLALLIAQSLRSLHALEQIQAEYLNKTQVSLRKLGLLNELLRTAQQRHVLIHSIVLTADPFAREELITQHGQLALDNNAARSRLEAGPLDTTERGLMQRLRIQNGLAYWTQDNIINTLRSDLPQARAVSLLDDELREHIAGVYRSLVVFREYTLQQADAGAERMHSLMAATRREALFAGIAAIFTGLLAAAATMWQLRRQQTSLHWHATHDPLTGLENRAAFNALLEQAVEDASRRQVTHGLLLLDLDRFKPVNDTHGHAAGDALLRGLAQTMKLALRGSDSLARLGGDEFAVLARDCPPEQLRQLGERLLQVISRHATPWQSHSLSAGVSIGAAQIPPGGRGGDAVLHQADRALYAAKHAGRGRLHMEPA
jgi:diguanylate cyclase (GGDEF)-like protein